MAARIKICGITSLEQALKLAAFGADYLGFIVDYRESPRSLNLTELLEVVPQLKLAYPGVKCVGVFVDSDPEFVSDVLGDIPFDVIQLHGNESPEYCASFLGQVEVWKAILIVGGGDIAKARQYRPFVNKILFDAGRGGGEKIDFSLLKGEEVDVIAGGLAPTDIEEITRTLNPKIIDLNSKVEISPGIKDLSLLEKLFQSL